MTERLCQGCGHSKQLHSKNGCTNFDVKTGKDCNCKKPYNDIR